MSGMKRWIVMAGLPVICFAGAFLASFLTAEPPAAPQAAAAPEPEAQNSQVAPSTWAAILPGAETVRPQAEELARLVKEVRHKLALCRDREKQLQLQEKRIRLAQEDLARQVQKLEDLRVQLVAPLARLKEIQAEVRRTRIQVQQQERANIKKIATIYEKKDPTAAGEILVAMCANGQSDDAVKILYFMSERSAGKILSDIPDRKLVAQLYEQMKRVETGG